MKREDLLEAMSFISEDVLQETEVKHRISGKTVGKLILIAATVAALAISVAAATGLFSRPIGEVGMITDETIWPFDMDSQGNITPGGVEGVKITMEVEMDAEIPTHLEKIYNLEMPTQWEQSGGGGSMGIYTYYSWFTTWATEEKPGEVRLTQSITDGKEKQQVVDLLHDLPEDTALTTEKTVVAGLNVLKLTIPKLPDYTGTRYCAGGETRLYWTDGQYILQFDYPYWMTDAEAEKLLSTLNSKDYIVPYPEDYGTVNTQRISQLTPEFRVEKGNTGTVMANSVMGNGRFAYSDGNIYYGGDGKLMAYNLESGAVKTTFLPSAYDMTFDLFATENYICYEDFRDGLVAMPKVGGEPVMIYQGLGIHHLYADGSMLYTNNAAEYLSRINLETGKVEILLEGGAYRYFVDDNYIYVAQGDGKNQIMRSSKDKIDFQPIPLSFYPVSVYADGDTLYLAKGGKDVQRQIIQYKDGVETKLPVYSWQYQILGDQLIYLDEIDKETLKSYDLNTGETKVLLDRAVDFSLMEGRYLGIERVDENRHTFPSILDLQTGKYYQFQ